MRRRERKRRIRRIDKITNDLFDVCVSWKRCETCVTDYERWDEIFSTLPFFLFREEFVARKEKKRKKEGKREE